MDLFVERYKKLVQGLNDTVDDFWHGVNDECVMAQR